jgi:hypothetical protein
LPRVALNDEYLSAILNRLNNEKAVSIGILISSEKSEESFHSFKILGFFKVSCFWANNPVEKARSSNMEMCLIINSKYRNYERDCCKSNTNHPVMPYMSRLRLSGKTSSSTRRYRWGTPPLQRRRKL